MLSACAGPASTRDAATYSLLEVEIEPVHYRKTGARAQKFPELGPAGRSNSIRCTCGAGVGGTEEAGAIATIRSAQMSPGAVRHTRVMHAASLSKTCANMPARVRSRYSRNDARDVSLHGKSRSAPSHVHARARRLWLAGAAARASERVVGLLTSPPLNDMQWTRLPTFKRGMEQRGWIEGRNLRYGIRSSHRLHQQPGRNGRQVAAIPQRGRPAARPASASCSIPRPCRAPAAIILEPIEQAAPTFGVTSQPVPIADPAADRRRDRGVMRATPAAG